MPYEGACRDARTFQKLLYFAILRDARNGRTARVPAAGAGAPDFAFVLGKPAVVKLGIHRFGRTRAPEAVVARAAAEEVGWELPPPGRGPAFGPQAFVVAPDRSIWLSNPPRGSSSRATRCDRQDDVVGYRFVEHAGEVEVELEASTEAGIFEAAVAAFAELAGADGKGEPTRHEVELAAGDSALLLVDWLNELVFLTEVERFVPEDVTAIELQDGHLRATLSGYLGSPSHLVKAATLNRLALAPMEGAWHGRVVLDV